jgi:hypothetical protein
MNARSFLSMSSSTKRGSSERSNCSTSTPSMKLALVDKQIDIVRRSRVILRDEAWRLKASMASLGIASALTAVGVSVR